MLEWAKTGDNRFQAAYHNIFVFLWLSDGLVHKEDKVWCWCLKDSDFHGINGGCADDKTTAMRQAETAIIQNHNEESITDLKYILIYADKLAKRLSEEVIIEKLTVEINKAYNCLRNCYLSLPPAPSPR